MSTFLLRISILYKLLYTFFQYLAPKKLRTYLPFSHTEQQKHINNERVSSFSSSSRPSRMVEGAELSLVFQMFDRDGDGRITKSELSASLEKMGIFIPGDELAQMITRVDVNGDGCVDIDEFSTLYQTIMDERNEEEDMKEAFNVFDQNGDGFISVEELGSVLASLGLRQGRGAEECEKMINKVDADGDGRVDFNEFKQMMNAGRFN
ncbi:calmodulin-like protein 3 [Salvia hispanica]|uniref:calmodulin-like protein 3 n=1 Tax=Salvia hispanica TaxID=49212 RepID=UPI0020097749|nr:calmodulin-like protein 3 [Salvia hispanica]